MNPAGRRQNTGFTSITFYNRTCCQIPFRHCEESLADIFGDEASGFAARRAILKKRLAVPRRAWHFLGHFVLGRFGLSGLATFGIVSAWNLH